MGYGYPMQPRSCSFVDLILLIVTKTPHRSNRFLGVLCGAIICFPVFRYSFTAFRASLTRNLPSPKLNVDGKSIYPLI